MTPASIERALAEQGWAVVDLPDPSPVHVVRDRLLAHLRAALPDLACLDDYHLHVPDDERHIALLHDLATFYWEQHLAQTIVGANLELVRHLVGADLHVQRRPYLRAVRPGVTRDAAPLHRDTYYGASPYEMSMLIPFTQVDAAGAMRVVSGSHLEPDAAYPFEQHQSPEVTMQSPRHQLGFPYAPKRLAPTLANRAVAVPLHVGQALVFGLSLVHGGGVNDSPRTRFSTDIRVVNSLAPVTLARGVDPFYFVPLCSSAITRSASRYVDANAGAGPTS
jgi:hypothetical protein